MSAYIESKAHIDALLRVAVSGPADRAPSYPGDAWSFGRTYYHNGEGRDFSLERVGAMLVTENATSVRYRYNDEPLADLPGPVDNDFVKRALLGESRRRGGTYGEGCQQDINHKGHHDDGSPRWSMKVNGARHCCDWPRGHHKPYGE